MDKSRRIFSFTLVLISAFLFQQAAFSKEIFNVQQTKITVKDGLSHNSVLSITKDEFGEMWIGTWYGLNRYNGHSIRHYFDSRFAGKQELPWDIRVAQLYADSKHNLWIMPNGDYIGKYDLYEDRFSEAVILDYKQHPNAVINSLLEDSEGNIWIGTSYGLLLMNEDRDGSHIFCTQNDVSYLEFRQNIKAIYEDSDHRLWIGTHDGLFVMIRNEDTYSIYGFTHDPLRPESISNNEIECIIEDSGKKLYVGTCHGLNILDISDLDPEKNTYPVFRRVYHDDNEVQSISGNGIYAMTQDQKGRIILRTDQAIDYMKEPGVVAFHHIYYPPFATHEKMYLKSLYYDPSGIIWFGLDDGLYKNNVDLKGFFNYPAADQRKEFKINCAIRDLRGNYYIGTVDNGLQVAKAPEFGKEILFSRVYLDPGVREVHSLARDDKGNIWIGSDFLYSINAENSRIERYPFMPDRIIHEWFNWKYVDDLHPINEKLLYCNVRSWSLGGMAFIFDKRKKRFYRMLIDTLNFRQHNISLGAHIPSFSRQGKILLNGWGHTLEIDTSFSEFIPNHLTPAVVDTVLFNSDRGISIAKSIGQKTGETGIIFTATGGRGLFMYTPISNDSRDDNRRLTKNQKFHIEQFTKNYGLPSNYISELEEDSRGNIWLSTSFGLSCFDPESKTFHNYLTEDGLAENHFIDGKFHDSDGTIHFISRNAVCSFHPDQLNIKKDGKRTIISECVVNGESITPFNSDLLSQSIKLTKIVRLSHQQNFLSINFFVPDYTQPEKNLYTYKLDGLEDDWSIPENNNKAVYTDLRPGKYLFRVKSFSSRQWNEESTLEIIIAPPFWLRWWFLVLAALLLASALTYFVRLRIQLLKKRNIELEVNVKKKTEEILEQREEIDQVKNRFFANISHEFRTPLTLIDGSAEQIRKKNRVPESAKFISTIKRSSRHLLNLVNEILELSKLESNRYRFNPAKNTIVSAARSVWSLYLSETERRNINYRFITEAEEIECCFDSSIINKVLHNLLSNAIRFSADGGEVSLSVLRKSAAGKDPDHIEFTISDNGPGIPEDMKSEIFNRYYHSDPKEQRMSAGTGIGLAIVKELIELHQGEIAVESKEGKTVFVVTIPCEYPGIEIELQDREGQLEEYAYIPSEGESISEGEYQHDTDKDGSPPDIGSKPVPGSKELPLVLVVEDNDELREHIVTLLAEDYRVIGAGNGNEGLRMALDNMPELILSDLMMPEMDGVELCKLIKSDPLTSHIPFVMLTARADKQSKLMGLKDGADDYVIKPFDPEVLIARIENLIKQRIALREKFNENFRIGSAHVSSSELDKQLINQIELYILDNVSMHEINVEKLCNEIGMSQPNLYRKLKTLTNYSISEFLNVIKIKHAVNLLEKGHTVSEAAYNSGYNNLSYFSKKFKQITGILPSEKAKL